MIYRYDLNSSEVISALSGLCAYLSLLLLLFNKIVFETAQKRESHTTLFLLQPQFVGTALTNHGPPWRTPLRSPRLSWQRKHVIGYGPVPERLDRPVSTELQNSAASASHAVPPSAAKLWEISLFATDSVSADGGLRDLTSLADHVETTMSSVAAIATKMDLDGFDIFQSQESCLTKVGSRETATKWNPIRIHPSTSKTVQRSFCSSHVGNWWGGNDEGN